MLYYKSRKPMCRNGRRGRLKICCRQLRVGSSPTIGTKTLLQFAKAFFLPISLKCVTSIPKCVIIDSKPIPDNPDFLSFQKGATPPLTLTLQNPAWQSLFSVPTAVVDQYLKLATPSQLKVLLYLLRHQPETIDTVQVGKQIGCLPEQVEEALLFWEQTDLFTPPEPPAPEKPQEVAALIRTSSELSILPTAIADAVQSSESLQTLFRMVQQLYGRPLNFMEEQSLVWLHDYLNFSSDIILMVVSYCHSIQKCNVRYIEQILIRWWNQGITTLQQAQEEIKDMEQRHSYLAQIMRLLEMRRNPTPKQMEFIDDWKQKAIPMDLIRYAYEKTVEKTDRLSFPYMQSILNDWMKAGYKTRAEVDLNDKPPESPRIRKKKQPEIPVSENAEAYASLIYNLDEPIGGNV